MHHVNHHGAAAPGQVAPERHQRLTPQSETPADGPALQGAEERSGDRADCAPSEREMRALRALLDGPVRREALDRICAASNGPDVVMWLRRRYGLDIPCQRRPRRDLDGQVGWPGTYFLTAADRLRAAAIVMAQGGAR